MGPSRASEPSLGPMSSCFTKQTGHPLEKQMNYILLFVFFLSSWQSSFVMVLLNCSHSAPLEEYKMEKVRFQIGGVTLSIFMSRKNSVWSLYCWFCSPIQICCRIREAEIAHDDPASLGCTKISDRAESQVRGLSVTLKQRRQFPFIKSPFAYISEDHCLLNSFFFYISEPYSGLSVLNVLHPFSSQSRGIWFKMIWS